MAKHSDHGIILDDESQEQPKDKERAQTVTKTMLRLVEVRPGLRLD